MSTLLIDNHDSYTFNLFQLIAEVNGGAAPLAAARPPPPPPWYSPQSASAKSRRDMHALLA